MATLQNSSFTCKYKLYQFISPHVKMDEGFLLSTYKEEFGQIDLS